MNLLLAEFNKLSEIDKFKIDIESETWATFYKLWAKNKDDLFFTDKYIDLYLFLISSNMTPLNFTVPSNDISSIVDEIASIENMDFSLKLAKIKLKLNEEIYGFNANFQEEFWPFIREFCSFKEIKKLTANNENKLNYEINEKIKHIVSTNPGFLNYDGKTYDAEWREFIYENIKKSDRYCTIL
jgi:hypothetical protein